jgi:hypothetical protein
MVEERPKRPDPMMQLAGAIIVKNVVKQQKKLVMSLFGLIIDLTTSIGTVPRRS